MAEHRLQLRKKLIWLCEKSPWTTNSLTDSVVNLSKADITKDQIRALGYGMSLNQKATAPTMVSAITDLLKCTRNSAEDGFLKGALVHGFLDIVQSDETMPRRLRVAIDDLTRRRDIMVMEADKGSKIVILDTEDYVRAGLDMLSDTSVYKTLTSTNPLQYRVDTFNKKFENNRNKLPVGC